MVARQSCKGPLARGDKSHGNIASLAESNQPCPKVVCCPVALSINRIDEVLGQTSFDLLLSCIALVPCSSTSPPSGFQDYLQPWTNHHYLMSTLSVSQLVAGLLTRLMLTLNLRHVWRERTLDDRALAPETRCQFVSCIFPWPQDDFNLLTSWM
jgi:hypothetical protein